MIKKLSLLHHLQNSVENKHWLEMTQSLSCITLPARATRAIDATRRERPALGGFIHTTSDVYTFGYSCVIRLVNTEIHPNK